MYASTFTSSSDRGRGTRAAVVEDGKASKAEQVLGLLTEEIMAGRLLPGEKLVEEEIAARLRCSRTPVREALRHLDAIGLVRFRPRHGATVAGASPRAVRDLFDALAELESLCAELASRRLDASGRQSLSRMADGGAFPAEAEVLSILHTASGNPVLVEMAGLVRTRLSQYLRKDEATGAGSSAATLSPVIRAVAVGDAAAARAAMHDHVLAGRAPQLP